MIMAIVVFADDGDDGDDGDDDDDDVAGEFGSGEDLGCCTHFPGATQRGLQNHAGCARRLSPYALQLFAKFCIEAEHMLSEIKSPKSVCDVLIIRIPLLAFSCMFFSFCDEVDFLMKISGSRMRKHSLIAVALQEFRQFLNDCRVDPKNKSSPILSIDAFLLVPIQRPLRMQLLVEVRD